MRDHASELRPVSFNFDQGVAKLGLFCPLGERFLQQTAKAVLLALNPENVLNFLARPRARNAGVQEQASDYLVAREAACICQVLQVSHVRIGQAHCDSMFQIPHLMSISTAIVLSSRNRFSTRE